MAELTNIDLCLLNTSITIEIILEECEKTILESINSNEGRIWKIKYPNNYLNDEINIKDIMSGFIHIIGAILFEVSLLIGEEFRNLCNNDFFLDLFSKVNYREYLYNSL